VVWRKLHQAGKNYFKKLAEQHNKGLASAPTRPKTVKKEEYTTNSHNNALAFMHSQIDPLTRSVVKKKEE